MALGNPSHLAQGYTILLVDDDAETLDTWAKGLQDCASDYTVLKADTVKSALDVCRYHKMDCVVLDLDMDDASGFEVLLDLVPDRKHRRIPVVVLTRLISPVLHDMAVEYGAQACLVKQRTSPQLLDEAIKTAIVSTGGHDD
jgi:two-component system sensor histidine kinase ChiS